MPHDHCDAQGHHHHHHGDHHHADHHHCCCCCCHSDHHHHHHGHEDFSRELLDLADSAWMEVLREKIKEQILAANGKQLDKLAKLVSDSNQSRWKNKLGANKATSEFRDKISEFFK